MILYYVQLKVLIKLLIYYVVVIQLYIVSLEKGHIYIPDSFIRYLTNDYINNNNDIISKINQDNNVSKIKYKSGNKDWPDHTKVNIKLV